jgi:hypothetical protein
MIKVSLNNESVMKDKTFVPRILVTGQEEHQYICHITLSCGNIMVKKLKQHSETNNSEIAKKYRDVFFKENVKQGDVSVDNYTTLYSKYFSFLIKSHIFCHLYR